MDTSAGATPSTATDGAGTNSGDVRAAVAHLTGGGAHLMAAPTVRGLLAADREEAWARFRAGWEELAPDPYAAARGSVRQRRYGVFSFTPATGTLTARPHVPFVQPSGTNPLHDGEQRAFEPLTGAFVADPVLARLLRLLGTLAQGLDGPPEWTVHVHPFRVLASAGASGEPTPEGRHQDGVTLVSTLLVDRANATGGQSTVTTPAGTPLLTAVLDEPGTLLVGDDRRTWHEVSALRPEDPARPARRDVLVTTFTPA
ncbi:2OG-Fe dioxygenase family protein [Streptomyces sp. 796.1]|uniref:2OG-Fe dioxygenase family protein n=1 Tax=Streptomyces sp. 796.1 TaxID=3163029 RepID=UPI0039C8E867